VTGTIQILDGACHFCWSLSLMTLMRRNTYITSIGDVPYDSVITPHISREGDDNFIMSTYCSSNSKHILIINSSNRSLEKLQHLIDDSAHLCNEENHDHQQVRKSLKMNSFQRAMVQRVIDGDTIELTNRKRVRFIGINTPESTYKIETYGKEARNYSQEKLAGRTIWLQKEISDIDRYGRLLRIVWLEQPFDSQDEGEIRLKMFNAELILNGYAEPSTFPPDVKYSAYFRQFAREARSQRVGLWRFGRNGATIGDFDLNM
jgi:micrococcal nuclease